MDGSTSGASAVSTPCCSAYERGLDVAMRWRLTTLVIFFATLAIVGLSLYHHSQGLLSRSKTSA